MVLIMIALGMLIIIAFFNVVLGASWETITASGGYGQPVGVDSLTGIIVIIIVVIAITSAIGFKILGSGFSDSSIKAIMLVTIYTSLWLIFSVIAYNLIIAIEYVGGLIYLTLTILYSIGVIQNLTNS